MIEGQDQLKSCYFPLNDDGYDEFAPLITVLERRRPKAIAALRRINCMGLAVRSIGGSTITMLPMMEAGEHPKFLDRDDAERLGVSKEELSEFCTMYGHSLLMITAKWQWGPPTFSFEKKNEAAALAADKEVMA